MQHALSACLFLWRGLVLVPMIETALSWSSLGLSATLVLSAGLSISAVVAWMA